MTWTIDNAFANAMLGQTSTTFPAGSVLEIRTGTKPAVDTAPTGTVLASITLPATPWTAAASHVIAKQGAWEGLGAVDGTPGHVRLRNAANTVGISGDIPGDATISSSSISVGQPVAVLTFQLTL